MSWEEAFAHPLLAEFNTLTPFLRDRDEKENRTPRRQFLQEIKDKENYRSKSKSVSANKKVSRFSRTPKNSKVLLKNHDLTPENRKMVSWKK